jgi:hypothetical protein
MRGSYIYLFVYLRIITYRLLNMELYYVKKRELLLSVGCSSRMKCILIKFMNTFGEIKKAILQACDPESTYRPRISCPQLASS